MPVSTDVQHRSDAFAARRLSRRAAFRQAAALGFPATWAVAPLARAAATPPRQSDQSRTLAVAIEGDVATLDPAFAVDPTAQIVLQNAFDQLTQYRVVDAVAPDGTPYQTVDTTQIEPMLCSSWQADGADLVFAIPDGLTFANGDPLDAAVVRDGFRRIFETGAYTSFLLGMGGAVTDAAAFSAPDPRTFAIRMSRPNVLISQNLVMINTSALDPAEIAAHRTDADPWATEFFKQHAGSASGPYALASYRPGDAATLVANPRHAGPPPWFTTVVLKVVPDPVERAALLHHGEVDLAMAVPSRDLADLQQDDGVRVLSLPSTKIALLALNGAVPPFDQQPVRQAVAAAAPYRAIVDHVYHGHAQPAPSLVPAGMPTSDPTGSPFVTDTAKAKALLAAAGYPGGAGLPPITLATAAGVAEREQTAVLIEAALRDLGLDVTIRLLAPGAYDQELQGGRLQCWVDGWFSWVNDPFYQLFWLASSQSPANLPRLRNDRVDELIQGFVLAEAGPDRDGASREAQALANAEANYVCLCQPDLAICTRRDIVGYVRYNDELPRFARMMRTG